MRKNAHCCRARPKVKVAWQKIKIKNKSKAFVVVIWQNRLTPTRPSPRKPRRAVVLAGRRRRRRRWRWRKQIGKWWQRFRGPQSAVRCRLLVGCGGIRRRWRTSVHFGVGLPLHLALVGAHVGDRHRYPIVDPRESLTVAEQQYLTDRLRKNKPIITTLSPWFHIVSLSVTSCSQVRVILWGRISERNCVWGTKGTHNTLQALPLHFYT